MNAEVIKTNIGAMVEVSNEERMLIEEGKYPFTPINAVKAHEGPLTHEQHLSRLVYNTCFTVQFVPHESTRDSTAVFQIKNDADWTTVSQKNIELCLKK